MNRSVSLFAFALLATVSAFGQVELGVVQVDASPLGADYVTADVFINVPDVDDYWTVGGIAGGPTSAGLQHHIHFDPNTEPYMTAPGNSTPQAEFATFVSLPRGQFSNARFRGGRASIPGAYNPPLPDAVFSLSEINLAFLEFPPPANGDNVPDFGFIARVTLHNTPALSGFATNDIVVSSTPLPGTLLAEYEVASATRNHPSPLSTLTFGFYAIPEPATVVMLILVAGLSTRRR